MSVEVQYLNGDSVTLDDCDTVGTVMTRVALLHDRYATEVCVINDGKVITDVTAVPPPSISVLFHAEDEVAPFTGAKLKENLRLHGAHGDSATCRRLLEGHENSLTRRASGSGPTSELAAMIRALGRTQEKPPDLAWVLSSANLCANEEREEKIVRTLLGIGLPLGEAMVRMSAEGCLSIVHLLMEECGMDIVNCSSDDGDNALTVASRNGHKRVVELLLQGGADVNHSNKFCGNSALIVAAEQGHIEVVSTLLKHGADVHHTNRYRQSAWHAAWERNFEGVAALIASSERSIGEDIAIIVTCLAAVGVILWSV